MPNDARPTTFHIGVTENPAKEDLALHAAQVWLHAARKTGQSQAMAPKIFSFVAKSPDGAVVGGLLAKIQLQTMFIEAAWVDTRFQRSGVGISLRKDVMKVAETQGCTHLIAMTYEFYDALNYLLKTEPGLIVVGELENCPPPHTLTFLALKLPFGAKEKKA